MPVTLEQAKQNAQAAYAPFVIDEFVKTAPIGHSCLFCKS